MGKILYGPQESPIEMDDRSLAHVKVVITAKLRRQEAFLLSWEIDRAAGSGRESVWMHPAIPLRFLFVGSRRPALNRAWLDLLAAAASQGELRLLPEPAERPSEQSASAPPR